MHIQIYTFLVVWILFVGKLNLIPKNSLNHASNIAVNHCVHDSILMDTLYYDLGGDIISVPTVFTPNGDGKDDSFYPRFEDKNIVITQYSIYTPEEWKDSRIMYSAKKLGYRENNEIERAWNGMSKYRETPYIADYEGPFKFRFYATKIYDNGQIKRITCRGWACVDKTN